MPTYRFFALDGSGEHVDRYYHMAECPTFGTRIEVDGRAFERQPTSSVVAAPLKDTDFVAHSLAINDPAFPRVNRHGEGVFTSKREVTEYMAKVRGRGETMAYDRWNFR